MNFGLSTLKTIDRVIRLNSIRIRAIPMKYIKEDSYSYVYDDKAKTYYKQYIRDLIKVI